MSFPYFDVVIGRQQPDSDKKRWHRIGRAWFHAGRDGKDENLSLELNSAPPPDADVMLFPPDEQEPVACAERFRVVVPIERETDEGARTYYHAIGTAFHNTPNGQRSHENFRLLLDSLPLTQRLLLFPARENGNEADRKDLPF